MVIVLVTVLVGNALVSSSENKGYASEECPHTSAGTSLQSSDPSRQQSVCLSCCSHGLNIDHHPCIECVSYQLNDKANADDKATCQPFPTFDYVSCSQARIWLSQPFGFISLSSLLCDIWKNVFFNLRWVMKAFPNSALHTRWKLTIGSSNCMGFIIRKRLLDVCKRRLILTQ